MADAATKQKIESPTVDVGDGTIAKSFGWDQSASVLEFNGCVTDLTVC
jgi:hypothetical protein